MGHLEYGSSRPCRNGYAKTRPDASRHDMQTAKHYIEFVALGMDGINAAKDEDWPKVKSVRYYWLCFTSEWAR